MLEKVITYLKEHFGQDDIQIIAMLAQGYGLTRDIHKKMNEECEDFIFGFDDFLQDHLNEITAYLDDIMEECSP